MIHYFWIHACFHLTRWFPREVRWKVRLVLLPLSACLIIPEFYILLQTSSTRYCPANLIYYLIADIAFTTFMLGLCFLLCQMDPLVIQVKIAFHCFGVLDAGLGIAIAVATLGPSASECQTNASMLYYCCLILSILHLITIGLVTFLTPFWISNSVWEQSVLNPRQKRGVCYEPVKCCTCLWHV